MALTAAKVLLDRGAIRGVHVIVPMRTIEENCLAYGKATAATTWPLSGGTIKVDLHGFPVALRTLAPKGRTDALIDMLHNPDPKHAIVSSHQQWSRPASRKKILANLPERLDGIMFAIDEASLTSDGTGGADATHFGLLVAVLRERGATVAFISAAPFRADGPAFGGTVGFVHLRLSEAIGHGICPAEVRVEHKLFEYRRKTPIEVCRDMACAQAVADWKAEGDRVRAAGFDFPLPGPHYIFHVPASSALGSGSQWRDALKPLLEAEGVRIGDVTGTEPKDSKRAADLIEGERRNILAQYGGHYDKRKHDVLISCQRMKIGTDWPLASHNCILSRMGEPNTAAQVVGRTLRNKGDIPGYPAAFAQTSVTTFVSPVLTTNIPAYLGDLRRTSLLLACHMEDPTTADTFRKVYIPRLQAHGAYPGLIPAGEAEMNARDLITRTAHLFECRHGHKPNGIEHWDFLRTTSEFRLHNPAGRTCVALTLLSLLDGKDAEDLRTTAVDAMVAALDATRAAAREAAAARRALLSRKTTEVDDALLVAFEEVITQFAHLTSTQVNVGSFLRFAMKLSGSNLRNLHTALRGGIHAIQRPTLEHTARAIEAFRAKVGKAPTTRSGDASKFFPFEATWKQIDGHLRERSLTLAIMGLEAPGIVNGPARSDAAAVDILRARRARGRGLPPLVPKDLSTGRYLTLKGSQGADATPDFGEPECWVSLSICAHHALRGMSGIPLQELARR